MEEEEGIQEKGLSSDEDKGFLSRSELPHGEHPLSLGETSVWNKYFQVCPHHLPLFCKDPAPWQQQQIYKDTAL